MNCRQVHQRLYAFLDQELGEAEIAEVRAHLGRCEGCDDRIVFERRFLEHLRDCCTGAEAPAGLRERIVVRLRELGQPSA